MEAVKGFYSEKSIEERINELREIVVNDDKLFEASKYLDRSFKEYYIGMMIEYGLNSIFKKEVINKIEEEIEEHIRDIEDVQSGKVIKTINQKLIEREINRNEKEYHKKLEDEKKYDKYAEIDYINSFYWSDYEDSIREVRGLDKDCSIF